MDDLRLPVPLAPDRGYFLLDDNPVSWSIGKDGDRHRSSVLSSDARYSAILPSFPPRRRMAYLLLWVPVSFTLLTYLPAHVLATKEWRP